MDLAHAAETFLVFIWGKQVVLLKTTFPFLLWILCVFLIWEEIGWMQSRGAAKNSAMTKLNEITLYVFSMMPPSYCVNFLIVIAVKRPLKCFIVY